MDISPSLWDSEHPVPETGGYGGFKPCVRYQKRFFFRYLGDVVTKVGFCVIVNPVVNLLAVPF